ncbi:MAG: hypothetical protein GX166_13525 [Clostridiaceae bacterium]|jgi:hypothetical protein|nr:hypothetical protein [Clostridiaceae bacterium]
MRVKRVFYHKAIVVLLAICLIAAFPLSSCTKKNVVKDENNLRGIYQGKSLKADFSLRVNITDTKKSVFTIALIDGVFDISYNSGIYHCTLMSLKVRLDSIDATMEYDSANTYSDEAAMVRITPYSSFLGVTFKATVDSTGNLTSLSGFSQVEENIRKSLDDYGNLVVEQAIFAAKEYLDESVIKMILGFFIGYVPEKSLELAENWVYSGKIKAPFMLSTNVTCTFNKLDDGKYIISTAGTLKTAIDEKNYSGIEYALTGTSESKIYLSKNSEVLRNGSYTESVTGYCYYTIDGNDVKDTVTMTRNISFSMREKV